MQLLIATSLIAIETGTDKNAIGRVNTGTRRCYTNDF